MALALALADDKVNTMLWKPLFLKTLLLILVAFGVLGIAQQRSAVTPPLLFGDGDYRIGPEDVLQVWVWKEPDISTTIVVRPDGKISVPLIGELDVKDKTVAQIQDEMRKKLLTYLSDPVVTVIVKEINYPKVTVIGRVAKPDIYKMRQRMTVLDAIALAGGFTEFARRDKVTIIRNNSSKQEKLEINLKRPTGALYVQPFDTVYVK